MEKREDVEEDRSVCVTCGLLENMKSGKLLFMVCVCGTFPFLKQLCHSQWAGV